MPSPLGYKQLSQSAQDQDPHAAFIAEEKAGIRDCRRKRGAPLGVCLLACGRDLFFVISYIESRRMVGAFQGRKLGVKFTELAVEDALLIGQKKLLVGSPVRLRVGGTNALWGTGQGGYMRVGLNRQVGCGYGCIL